MRFDIITLFPEMFVALNYGITRRAQENNLININFWNPRDYTCDSYHKVDDSPYGGGGGMIMLFEPLYKTIQAARAASTKENPEEKATVIYLTPQGKTLNHELVMKLFSRNTQDSRNYEKNFILLNGRYEGIDERIIKKEVDIEISIGDYVLSGGELASMVLIDALTRQIPGALGHENSAKQDSFVDNLLDYPQYTRPESIMGYNVPEILLSGDHAKIANFRRKQSLGRTWLRRPDLLAKIELTELDSMLLNEFIKDD